MIIYSLMQSAVRDEGSGEILGYVHEFVYKHAGLVVLG